MTNLKKYDNLFINSFKLKKGRPSRLKISQHKTVGFNGSHELDGRNGRYL